MEGGGKGRVMKKILFERDCNSLEPIITASSSPSAPHYSLDVQGVSRVGKLENPTKCVDQCCDDPREEFSSDANKGSEQINHTVIAEKGVWVMEKKGNAFVSPVELDDECELEGGEEIEYNAVPPFLPRCFPLSFSSLSATVALMGDATTPSLGVPPEIPDPRRRQSDTNKAEDEEVVVERTNQRTRGGKNEVPASPLSSSFSLYSNTWHGGKGREHLLGKEEVQERGASNERLSVVVVVEEEENNAIGTPSLSERPHEEEERVVTVASTSPTEMRVGLPPHYSADYQISLCSRKTPLSLSSSLPYNPSLVVAAPLPSLSPSMHKKINEEEEAERRVMPFPMGITSASAFSPTTAYPAPASTEESMKKRKRKKGKGRKNGGEREEETVEDSNREVRKAMVPSEKHENSPNDDNTSIRDVYDSTKRTIFFTTTTSRFVFIQDAEQPHPLQEEEEEHQQEQHQYQKHSSSSLPPALSTSCADYLKEKSLTHTPSQRNPIPAAEVEEENERKEKCFRALHPTSSPLPEENSLVANRVPNVLSTRLEVAKKKTKRKRMGEFDGSECHEKGKEGRPSMKNEHNSSSSGTSSTSKKSAKTSWKCNNNNNNTMHRGGNSSNGADGSSGEDNRKKRKKKNVKKAKFAATEKKEKEEETIKSVSAFESSYCHHDVPCASLLQQSPPFSPPAWAVETANGAMGGRQEPHPPQQGSKGGGHDALPSEKKGGVAQLANPGTASPLGVSSWPAVSTVQQEEGDKEVTKREKKRKRKKDVMMTASGLCTPPETIHTCRSPRTSDLHTPSDSFGGSPTSSSFSSSLRSSSLDLPPMTEEEKTKGMWVSGTHLSEEMSSLRTVTSLALSASPFPSSSFFLSHHAPLFLSQSATGVNSKTNSAVEHLLHTVSASSFYSCLGGGGDDFQSVAMEQEEEEDENEEEEDEEKDNVFYVQKIHCPPLPSASVNIAVEAPQFVKEKKFGRFSPFSSSEKSEAVNEVGDGTNEKSNGESEGSSKSTHLRIYYNNSNRSISEAEVGGVQVEGMVGSGDMHCTPSHPLEDNVLPSVKADDGQASNSSKGGAIRDEIRKNKEQKEHQPLSSSLSISPQQKERETTVSHGLKSPSSFCSFPSPASPSGLLLSAALECKSIVSTETVPPEHVKQSKNVVLCFPSCRTPFSPLPPSNQAPSASSPSSASIVAPTTFSSPPQSSFSCNSLSTSYASPSSSSSPLPCGVSLPANIHMRRETLCFPSLPTAAAAEVVASSTPNAVEKRCYERRRIIRDEGSKEEEKEEDDEEVGGAVVEEGAGEEVGGGGSADSAGEIGSRLSLPLNEKGKEKNENDQEKCVGAMSKTPQQPLPFPPPSSLLRLNVQKDSGTKEEELVVVMEEVLDSGRRMREEGGGGGEKEQKMDIHDEEEDEEAMVVRVEEVNKEEEEKVFSLPHNSTIVAEDIGSDTQSTFESISLGSGFSSYRLCAASSVTSSTELISRSAAVPYIEEGEPTFMLPSLGNIDSLCVSPPCASGGAASPSPCYCALPVQSARLPSHYPCTYLRHHYLHHRHHRSGSGGGNHSSRRAKEEESQQRRRGSAVASSPSMLTSKESSHLYVISPLSTPGVSPRLLPMHSPRCYSIPLSLCSISPPTPGRFVDLREQTQEGDDEEEKWRRVVVGGGGGGWGEEMGCGLPAATTEVMVGDGDREWRRKEVYRGQHQHSPSPFPYRSGSSPRIHTPGRSPTAAFGGGGGLRAEGRAGYDGVAPPSATPAAMPTPTLYENMWLVLQHYQDTQFTASGGEAKEKGNVESGRGSRSRGGKSGSGGGGPLDSFAQEKVQEVWAGTLLHTRQQGSSVHTPEKTQGSNPGLSARLPPPFRTCGRPPLVPRHSPNLSVSAPPDGNSADCVSSCILVGKGGGNNEGEEIDWSFLQNKNGELRDSRYNREEVEEAEEEDFFMEEEAEKRNWGRKEDVKKSDDLLSRFGVAPPLPSCSVSRLVFPGESRVTEYGNSLQVNHPFPSSSSPPPAAALLPLRKGEVVPHENREGKTNEVVMMRMVKKKKREEVNDGGSHHHHRGDGGDGGAEEGKEEEEKMGQSPEEFYLLSFMGHQAYVDWMKRHWGGEFCSTENVSHYCHRRHHDHHHKDNDGNKNDNAVSSPLVKGTQQEEAEDSHTAEKAKKKIKKRKAEKVKKEGRGDEENEEEEDRPKKRGTKKRKKLHDKITKPQDPAEMNPPPCVLVRRRGKARKVEEEKQDTDINLLNEKENQASITFTAAPRVISDELILRIAQQQEQHHQGSSSLLFTSSPLVSNNNHNNLLSDASPPAIIALRRRNYFHRIVAKKKSTKGVGNGNGGGSDSSSAPVPATSSLSTNLAGLCFSSISPPLAVIHLASSKKKKKIKSCVETEEEGARRSLRLPHSHHRHHSTVKVHNEKGEGGEKVARLSVAPSYMLEEKLEEKGRRRKINKKKKRSKGEQEEEEGKEKEKDSPRLRLAPRHQHHHHPSATINSSSSSVTQGNQNDPSDTLFHEDRGTLTEKQKKRKKIVRWKKNRNNTNEEERGVIEKEKPPPPHEEEKMEKGTRNTEESKKIQGEGNSSFPSYVTATTIIERKTATITLFTEEEEEEVCALQDVVHDHLHDDDDEGNRRYGGWNDNASLSSPSSSPVLCLSPSAPRATQSSPVEEGKYSKEEYWWTSEAQATATTHPTAITVGGGEGGETVVVLPLHRTQEKDVHPTEPLDSASKKGKGGNSTLPESADKHNTMKKIIIKEEGDVFPLFHDKKEISSVEKKKEKDGLLGSTAPPMPSQSHRYDDDNEEEEEDEESHWIRVKRKERGVGEIVQDGDLCTHAEMEEGEDEEEEGSNIDSVWEIMGRKEKQEGGDESHSFTSSSYSFFSSSSFVCSSSYCPPSDLSELSRSVDGTLLFSSFSFVAASFRSSVFSSSLSSSSGYSHSSDLPYTVDEVDKKDRDSEHPHPVSALPSSSPVHNSKKDDLHTNSPITPYQESSYYSSSSFTSSLDSFSSASLRFSSSSRGDKEKIFHDNEIKRKGGGWKMIIQPLHPEEVYDEWMKSSSLCHSHGAVQASEGENSMVASPAPPNEVDIIRKVTVRKKMGSRKEEKKKKNARRHHQQEQQHQQEERKEKELSTPLPPYDDYDGDGDAKYEKLFRSPLSSSVPPSSTKESARQRSQSSPSLEVLPFSRSSLFSTAMMRPTSKFCISYPHLKKEEEMVMEGMERRTTSTVEVEKQIRRGLTETKRVAAGGGWRWNDNDNMGAGDAAQSVPSAIEEREVSLGTSSRSSAAAAPSTLDASLSFSFSSSSLAHGATSRRCREATAAAGGGVGGAFTMDWNLESKFAALQREYRALNLCTRRDSRQVSRRAEEGVVMDVEKEKKCIEEVE